MAKKDKAKEPVTRAKDVQQALKDTISNIEKDFGKGAVMKLGESAAKITSIETIPTGSLSLDDALGVGGIPKGRVIEVYGPESSGKTTIALHMVAECQKAGGIAAFIDAEHALDPIYARSIGVNIDELYISQPDDGEQALEICEQMVRSGAIDIIIIDSVAALVPRAEIEGTMGDSHMGLQARLMSQALRKITGVANKTGCTLLFINQLREKIGVVYGSNETTTGGRALKFYASVRLDIRRAEVLKQGDKMIGNRTRVKVVKNKVAPPFKTVEFDIMYGQGISVDGDVLDVAVDKGIVDKSGAWFSYGEERLGQGREKVKILFAEKPWLRREIENKVRESLGLAPLPVIEEVVASEESKEVEADIDVKAETEENTEDVKETKTTRTRKTKKAKEEEEAEEKVDEEA